MRTKIVCSTAEFTANRELGSHVAQWKIHPNEDCDKMKYSGNYSQMRTEITCNGKKFSK
jgi:hypothetical protein